ncbi:MAG TPA: carboxypeptidase-like regulatory domain-containing protein [Verrucomicrobiae bacterium]|nr:carboxypeptidase-like regulatory domain-containing protein [Verrucomicrobiae bacterium]
MKWTSSFLFAVLLGASGFSQSASPAKRAAIDGTVTKEPGSEPVKKALIELIAEDQTSGGDYTAISAPDGSFRIEGILPGRYRLFAERTGYLEFDKHHSHSEGRVLTLGDGQELKSLQIDLQAAAVVRGRVTDEDGDPLPNAQVSVMRQTFSSGHNRLEQIGSERTNDLGEYRVAGLAPGNYYVSVNPPPDLKSLIENSGASSQGRTADKPSMSYQTTYYPGTPDRSEAVSIQLHPGDEFPVNFSLTPGPTLSVRGAVVNLPPRSTAIIMLQSRDFNTVLSGADMHKDGSFEIHDVSPGSYTILASIENGPVPMLARQSLQVSGSSVEGVRLAPQPGGSIRGRLHFENKGSLVRFDPTQVFLALRSADGDDSSLTTFGMGEGFSHITHVAGDGSFEWDNVPPGNFYLQFIDGSSSSDWYLKSVLASGREVNESGLMLDGGTVVLDVTVSNNGAMLGGITANEKGDGLSNATVVAVPEAKLRQREDHFFKAVTDQTGRFMLRGMPPGEYTVFAWESLDGDSFYDPDFLKSYEGQGVTMRLGEGDHKSVQVKTIPDKDVAEN